LTHPVFSITTKKELEGRLLKGRSLQKGEEEAQYIERRAMSSLNRIYWLKEHGCQFSFDIDLESAKLLNLAPRWENRHAKNAAKSLETRVGWVKKNTEYCELLKEPLSTLLSKAAELSKYSNEIFIENALFTGLASKRPVRAYMALIYSMKQNIYQEWAWTEFLDPEIRKTDKPKFVALIAERISRMPVNVLAKILYPVSEWILKSSEVLLFNYPGQFKHIWKKLILVIKLAPESAKTSVIRGKKEPDWAMEAINAPVGKLAEALMKDPIRDNFELGKGFPILWISRVETLLTLEGDLHRHALVIFSYCLNWFFLIDPIWTEQNLILALNQDDVNQDAFWAGFFWGSQRPPTLELFIRLKPHFLKLIQQESMTRKVNAEVLSGILLSGWSSNNQETGERYVTNSEIRDVLINTDDEVRSWTLWLLQRWSSEDEGNEWRAKLPSFLEEVWPRHKRAKSPRVSAALCSLAFSDDIIFPKIIDVIISLVTVVDQEHFILPDFDDSKNSIVDKYPERTLALLYIVLPEKVSLWPYGINSILERIGIADPTLQNDDRLIELKRRWNAR
jgi:hypothetical protein